MNLIMLAMDIQKKYKFLLKQLVLRDIKNKYRRSVLGILWSILNPLLTMIVLNIVFSTMFKEEVKNYMAYLLCGLVTFNFFSDATNQGLLSVFGNAHLIKKVYIPKYIFPVSKVVSTSVNFLFSLVALYLILFASGLTPTWSHLMLPFILLCIIMFTMGISFILSVLMVFFKDTMFLYGVFLMMWMYATPIMYPESLIPAKFSWLFHLNPLYYYIHYLRSIVIDGIVPSLSWHLITIAFSISSLAIGLYIFKKSQDKFIMYL